MWEEEGRRERKRMKSTDAQKSALAREGLVAVEGIGKGYKRRKEAERVK